MFKDVQRTKARPAVADWGKAGGGTFRDSDAHGKVGQLTFETTTPTTSW